MDEVPVIDISGWRDGPAEVRRGLAATVNEACRKWGFLVVSGHGIDQALIDRMFSVTYSFFDLSDQEKDRYNATGRKGGRGYFSVGKKALARTSGDKDAPADQKETFYTGSEAVPGDPYYATPGAERLYTENIWPSEPAELKQVWTDYRAACQGVADSLMSIFAVALGMPEDWFSSRSYRPASTLVAHHYPAQASPPVEGALRAGAHTDFGMMTLLMTEDRPGGLQVLGQDGAWHDIKPVPGAFIVNLGDLMQRWTNDTWRSTQHRVVNPPADAGSEARRLSVVYFHTPNYDTEVSCFESLLAEGMTAKYPTITVGAHHLEKISLNNSVGKA